MLARHSGPQSPSPSRADILRSSAPSDNAPSADATDAMPRKAAQRTLIPSVPVPHTPGAVPPGAVPTYVKLKAGKGSPGALEVLSRDGVFQVLPTSPKTTLHLANVKTGRRVRHSPTPRPAPQRLPSAESNPRCHQARLRSHPPPDTVTSQPHLPRPPPAPGGG